ncbi:MAG: S41 family peptidase, partial [Verrucomicrobiales bacterium]|nr:S41 family peptidase [Verrucomicrobiales bacterium]
GLLNSAIDVCGEFVKAGTVVLTTEGKPGSGEIKIYRTSAEAKRRTRDYPLAILVNHSSASGAEVVSGALQDLKRCIVVGETTFGKGSVQSIIPIGDGKAIRMTTAKYYTPSHRTIHENGVVPNIVATLTPAQEQALAEWFGKDTLSPEEQKKLENFNDSQLIRAVDAMKGALVYSTIRGGGEPATAAPAVEEKKEAMPADKPGADLENAPEKEGEKSPDKPAPAPEKSPAPADSANPAAPAEPVAPAPEASPE